MLCPPGGPLQRVFVISCITSDPAFCIYLCLCPGLSVRPPLAPPLSFSLSLFLSSSLLPSVLALAMDAEWHRDDCTTGRFTSVWSCRPRYQVVWPQLTMTKAPICVSNMQAQQCSLHTNSFPFPLGPYSSNVHCVCCHRKLSACVSCVPVESAVCSLHARTLRKIFPSLCHLLGSGVCEIKYHLKEVPTELPRPSPQQVKVESVFCQLQGRVK